MADSARAGLTDQQEWSDEALARARSVLDGQPSTAARTVMAKTRGRSLLLLGIVVAFAMVLVPVSIITFPPADLAISSGRRIVGRLVDAVAAVLVIGGIFVLMRAENGASGRSPNPATALTRPELRQVDTLLASGGPAPGGWGPVVGAIARRRAADLGGAVLVPAGFAVLMVGRILGDAGPYYQAAGAVLCVVALVVLVIRGLRWSRARSYLKERGAPEDRH